MSEFKTPGRLFSPARVRSPGEGNPGFQGEKKLADSDQKKDFLLEMSGTFRFDQLGQPLKSTQQLNLDFSKFENHTFFNSARSKTHIAFDKILNFPVNC